MQREKAAGVSFREEIIEVAFEQRIERGNPPSKLRRSPSVTGDRYRMKKDSVPDERREQTL